MGLFLMDEGAFCLSCNCSEGKKSTERSISVSHSSVSLAGGLTGFILQTNQAREHVLTFPEAVLEPLASSSMSTAPQPAVLGAAQSLVLLLAILLAVNCLSAKTKEKQQQKKQINL